MNRRFFIFVLMAAGVATASADEQTLVISSNNTPLDRKVLEQVSQEAFRRLGMAFKMTSLPSERSLTSANQGEVDGEGLRVAGLSSQYPDLTQVPEPYVRISFVAFSGNPDIDLSAGWTSLKSYNVAFVTGWKMFEANATGAKTVTKVDKPEQAFLMLAAGRVDLALYTRADGLALVRSMGLPAIAPLAPALKDVDLYLYLNKKHQTLVPRLTQVLRDLKTDGSHARILNAINAQ